MGKNKNRQSSSKQNKPLPQVPQIAPAPPPKDPESTVTSPSSNLNKSLPPPPPVPADDRRRTGGLISTEIDPVALASSSTFSPSSPQYDDVNARFQSRSRSHSHSHSYHRDTDEGDDSSESVEMNTMSSGAESDEETGLTAAARNNRRKKKDRRRGFGGLSADGGKMRDGTAGRRRSSDDDDENDDDRPKIVNGIAVTKEVRKMADVQVLRNITIDGMLITMWYIFSLIISLYNKWMFSPKHLNFKYPLFITSVHMVCQFTFSALALLMFPRFRPGYFLKKQRADAARQQQRNEHRDDPFNADSDDDEAETLLQREQDQQAQQQQTPPKKQSIMTLWFYVSRITPCGLATGLDIGLGNMSLRFISLTFYTMCKSSSLAFVLCFAFLFRLEKPTTKLIGIIGIMTAGVVLMVVDEVEFILKGFILVMTAAMLSGLRWSLTQLLLLRNPATSNPFSSLFFLAPVMFFGLITIALPVEGVTNLSQRWGELVDERGFFNMIGLLLFPGVIAFLMTVAEFALLKRTSVVTLSVCGIFKELLTISASATVYHDKLTIINMSGVAVTICSIAFYNYLKIKQMRGDAVRDVVVESERAERRSVDGGERERMRG